MTIMVEEVGRRIADGRWILIEDRSAGAGAGVLTMRRRMVDHLVEGGAPVIQPHRCPPLWPPDERTAGRRDSV